MQAVRIHKHGGPEVLQYETAPDPKPEVGKVVVQIKAAAMNHLDLWVRRGVPGIPLPMILGSDGAGIISEVLILGAIEKTWAVLKQIHKEQPRETANQLIGFLNKSGHKL